MTWYLFIAAWAVLSIIVYRWATRDSHPARCTCDRRLRDLGVYDSDCPEHGITPLRRVA